MFGRFWVRVVLPLSMVTLLAGGCSLARFGYDAFPWWAMWQLDGYFDLDDGQRVLARQTIDDLRAWHQRSELPQYARLLKQVDERIQKADGGQDDALRPVEFRAWRETLVSSWAPLVDRLSGPTAQLLGSLRPAQVEHLKAKLDEDNRDMVRKYKLDSPKGMAQARADRMIERAEFFLGRLTSDQKRELREMAADLPADENLWLAERQTRQQGLLALIERLRAEKPAPAVGAAWTRDYLMSVTSFQDPQRRERLERAQRASDELTVRVVNEASEAQRRNLSKKLREFAVDFERRAGKAS